jgi:hypothetical protein
MLGEEVVAGAGRNYVGEAVEGIVAVGGHDAVGLNMVTRSCARTRQSNYDLMSLQMGYYGERCFICDTI